MSYSSGKLHSSCYNLDFIERKHNGGGLPSMLNKRKYQSIIDHSKHYNIGFRQTSNPPPKKVFRFAWISWVVPGGVGVARRGYASGLIPLCLRLNSTGESGSVVVSWVQLSWVLSQSGAIQRLSELSDLMLSRFAYWRIIQFQIIKQ